MESRALSLVNIRIQSLPAPSLHASQSCKKHSAAVRFQQGIIMYAYGYRPRRDFLSPLDALDIIHENAVVPPNDDALPAR